MVCFFPFNAIMQYQSCWKCNRRIWYFPSVATVSTDNPSTDQLLYSTELEGPFRITNSLNMDVIQLLLVEVQTEA
jgi:hypothetical protein